MDGGPVEVEYQTVMDASIPPGEWNHLIDTARQAEIDRMQEEMRAARDVVLGRIRPPAVNWGQLFWRWLLWEMIGCGVLLGASYAIARLSG
jgi:hypothetical protein